MCSMTTRKKLIFNSDDEYNTTKEIWEQIKDFIPKDKIIFEAFLLNNTSSKSVQILRDLGCNVVGDSTIDFFNSSHINYDVIVSNPPYSCKKKIFTELARIDKPFILILPVSTVTKQFVKVLKREKIQLIIPSKRLQFCKGTDQLNRCWFDCVYFCYKMDLSKDINFA